MSNIFLDKSNLIKMPVSSLKVGMFVAELDRPWLETPFFVQGFIIKHLSEIKKLQEYCSFVYVEKQGKALQIKKDPFKSGFSNVKRSATGEHDSGLKQRASQRNQPSMVQSLKSRTAYPITTPAYLEHSEARKTHKYAKATITNIMEQARLGAAIETDAAKIVVKECVESMMRNPDALMWMAKIKHVDQYTLEHCLNVGILAIAFGRHLRLKDTDIEKLGLCGLLHDVGKMQIPDEILNKPHQLNDEEKKIMQSHPVLGRDLLMKRKDAMIFTIDSTFNHHERIDGKGYPRGLEAHEISNFSRIISIVDAFDAMTSERCYDASRSTLDALKEIYKCRGAQFDEELALEFIQLIGPYPPGTIVELKNDMVGIVLTSQETKRHLPCLRILLDENKKNCDHQLIDLSDVEKGTLPQEFLIRRVLKDGTYNIKLEEHTDEMVNIKAFDKPGNTLEPGNNESAD